MRTLQRLYMLIHTPVHIGRPVFMGTVEHAEWSNALFEKYMADVERSRQAGGSYSYISKRDIERWGFFPPCGARVQVVDVEIPIGESQPRPKNINDIE